MSLTPSLLWGGKRLNLLILQYFLVGISIFAENTFEYLRFANRTWILGTNILKFQFPTIQGIKSFQILHDCRKKEIVITIIPYVGGTKVLFVEMVSFNKKNFLTEQITVQNQFSKVTTSQKPIFEDEAPMLSILLRRSKHMYTS